MRNLIDRARNLVRGILPLEKALSVDDEPLNATTLRKVFENFRNIVNAAVYIKQGESAADTLRGIPVRFHAEAKRVLQELNRFFVLRTQGSLAGTIQQRQQDQIVDVESDMDGVLRATKSLIEKSANAEMSRSAEALYHIGEGYRQQAVNAIPAQTLADLPHDHIIYESISAYESAAVTSSKPLVRHEVTPSGVSILSKSAIAGYFGATIWGGPVAIVLGIGGAVLIASSQWAKTEKANRQKTYEQFTQAIIQDIATACTGRMEQTATEISADVTSRLNSVSLYIQERLSASENLLKCFDLEMSQIEVLVDNSENLLSEIDVLLAELEDATAEPQKA